MKAKAIIALWFLVIALIFKCAIGYDSTSAAEDCEVRIAEKLNTTAVYIDGHCMVKGYGRFQ